jgi:hypothetical protein
METKERIAELRAKGLTPKQIARSLGLRPAEVAEIVRVQAATSPRVAAAPAVECLISPGWSRGLGLDDAGRWGELDVASGGASQGLVSVLIAREQRYGKAEMCGYLVDVFCLGVKNAIGPRSLDPIEGREFAAGYFRAYDERPLAVPFELAQSVVLGAVDFARRLGFEPHPDFERVRPQLGDWRGPSPIVFGDGGRPHLIPGPRDDAERAVATLRRTVGDGNFTATIFG